MTRIEEERIDEMLADEEDNLRYLKENDWGIGHIRACEQRIAIITELKELRAQGGVSVRPLVWEQTDPHFPWAAQSLIGRYTAWDFDGKDGHWMRPSDVAGVRVKGGLEEAKSAAEADYRTRILSALETEAVEPVAWVGDYRKSDGTTDFYVMIGSDDREMSLHMHRIRGRAEYEAAEINHVLTGSKKPEFDDFELDDHPPLSSIPTVTDAMVERLAISVFDQDSDNDTVPWERQPGRVRNQTRKQVRQVLTALRIHFPAALSSESKP